MTNPPSIQRASDLMERDVVAVDPDTRILDVHRLFVEEEIHGAPVVGDDGIVVGVISSQDLLRVANDDLEPVDSMTAADAMTRELVTVGVDATIGELARTMLANRVHRVLVTDAGSLQGIVSTFDLLRVLTEPHVAR